MANWNRLNALAVQKANQAGLYGDGGGLYLQVSAKGTKSWIFRFTFRGRKRMAGLGSFALVSLSEARDAAMACRRMLKDGIDPIEAKQEKQRQLSLKKARSLTFDEGASAYIASHRSGWKNEKHAEQWKTTIQSYASPIIGGLAIGEVDTALVMRVIEPIWLTKTETANRLRNRIELILDWAAARGHRNGENPARWAGHLDHLLPKRSDLRNRKHFAALPFTEMGEFMATLRKLDGIAPRALEFCILTATRTSETMGARHSEISNGIWTIPAERMKAGREHRVPLSPRALQIVSELSPLSDGGYLFPGRSPNRTLCNNAFLAILKRRMNLKVTGHGFRSAFRDWAAERTSFSREVVEMALAHAIKDATEAAYRRGDLLLKRQALMNAWAEYCDKKASLNGEIFPINQRRA
jgi:integrase